MLLIKNVNVYAPENLGINDILVAGGKIERIEPGIDMPEAYVEIVDGTGKTAIPGLIDPHVHITGGGGEGGSCTRAPEISVSELVLSGITTVVGLLGTDGISRTPANLFSKTRALREEGVTAYALTGSYRYPTVTLTGDIQTDIVYIDECIGAKIAISDHRSSMVTAQELARMASEVRVAGMLAKKPGFVTIHMGDGKKGLAPVFEVVEETDLPITILRPTHVNRNKELLNQAFKYAKMGGYIDLTCGIYDDASPVNVIEMAAKEEVPLDRITFSTDGGGSFSSYDEEGRLVKIGVSGVAPLFKSLVAMVDNGWGLDDALPFVSTNAAKSMGWTHKGVLKEGADADILLLNENMSLHTVMAMGTFFIKAEKLIKAGNFE